jgi:hypothetical protein
MGAIRLLRPFFEARVQRFVERGKRCVKARAPKRSMLSLTQLAFAVVAINRLGLTPNGALSEPFNERLTDVASLIRTDVL